MVVSVCEVRCLRVGCARRGSIYYTTSYVRTSPSSKVKQRVWEARTKPSGYTPWPLHSSTTMHVVDHHAPSGRLAAYMPPIEPAMGGR